MARHIHDGGLDVWEAFASTGDHGFADKARIVFHCRSDRSCRPRAVTIDGEKADAEERVTSLSDEELRELLAGAAEIR